MMCKTVLLVLLVLLSVISGAEFKKILARGVSNAGKKKIINAHNEYRLLLQRGKIPKQPRSIDMHELCWDDALAKGAQIIADKMIYQHQPIDDDRWGKIGQNMAQKSSTASLGKSADWPWAIRLWFNEVKKYSYGSNANHGTGHYTQVAWAKTTHVGCGFTYYMDPSKKLKYRHLYYCNYGPGGNIAGMKPYKTGRCGCKGLCNTKCEKPLRNATNNRIEDVDLVDMSFC